MRAYRLNLDQAEMFFRICQELGATTENQRIQILDAMARGGDVESIVETKLSKEGYVKHLAKHFGKVLNITNKSKPETDN